MIDKETKEFRPVTQFLNAEQLSKDVAASERRRTREVSFRGGRCAFLAAQLRSVRGA